MPKTSLQSTKQAYLELNDKDRQAFVLWLTQGASAEDVGPEATTDTETIWDSQEKVRREAEAAVRQATIALGRRRRPTP